MKDSHIVSDPEILQAYATLPEGYTLLGRGNTFKVPPEDNFGGIAKRSGCPWSAPGMFVGCVNRMIYAAPTGSKVVRMNKYASFPIRPQLPDGFDIDVEQQELITAGVRLSFEEALQYIDKLESVGRDVCSDQYKVGAYHATVEEIAEYKIGCVRVTPQQLVDLRDCINYYTKQKKQEDPEVEIGERFEHGGQRLRLCRFDMNNGKTAAALVTDDGYPFGMAIMREAGTTLRMSSFFEQREIPHVIRLDKEY